MYYPSKGGAKWVNRKSMVNQGTIGNFCVGSLQVQMSMYSTCNLFPRLSDVEHKISSHVK